MFLKDRIKCFAALGIELKNLNDDQISDLALAAGNENPWFTEVNVSLAIKGIAHFLDHDTLDKWIKRYNITDEHPNIKIGIVAAGNIPMVGFHDMLCVLIAGYSVLLKPSSTDNSLMRYIIQMIVSVEPRFLDRITIVDRLNDADAYIATGSDNTARYFKQYFGQKPNLIRGNRTSVAVLKGDETLDEIKLLGMDIFQYYGLGCRNVSKLYVPEGYDFQVVLDGLVGFDLVGNHHKYRNNYDYNKSIYLVNREPHLDTGFLLVKENEELVSPISVLYYQHYSSAEHLAELIRLKENKIQCVVGRDNIPFGQAQKPEVWDYSDGIDTMAYLLEIAI